MSEPIRCPATGKMLAKREGNVVLLWCKECRSEHRIPSQEESR